MPDGIDPIDAAPLTCAGVTTYKALKVAQLPSPASLVAVFGAGGLGHLAIQYAHIMGASVIAVDTNPARLETALEVGAECVGLPAENGMTVPIFETVLGGLTLRGSIVGTHHDLEEVFELHRLGLTEVEKSEVALDDVNEAIESVLDGSAPSPRLVFRISTDDGFGASASDVRADTAAVSHA